MTTTETNTLREAFALLQDATQCASMKLGQPTPSDFSGDCARFDTAPEQAILREAKRLRELVAKL